MATTIVSDTFTDLNNTLLQNHNPDIGNAGSWNRLSGVNTDMIISSAAPGTVGVQFIGSTPLYQNTTANIVNGSIEIALINTLSIGYGPRLIARLTSTSNFYEMRCNGNGVTGQATISLFRGVTQLGSSVTVGGIGNGTIFKFIFVGNSLTGFVNGVLSISATDSTFTTGLPGFGGVSTSNAAQIFDNYKAIDTGPLIQNFAFGGSDPKLIIHNRRQPISNIGDL